MADVEVSAGTQTVSERYGVSRYDALLNDDDHTVNLRALDSAEGVRLGITIFDAEPDAQSLTDVRSPAITLQRPGLQPVEFRFDPQDMSAVLVNGVQVTRDEGIRPYIELIQEQSAYFDDFARSLNDAGSSNGQFTPQSGSAEKKARLSRREIVVINRIHLVAGIGMRFGPYGMLIFGPTFVGLSFVRLIAGI